MPLVRPLDPGRRSSARSRTSASTSPSSRRARPRRSPSIVQRQSRRHRPRTRFNRFEFTRRRARSRSTEALAKKRSSDDRKGTPVSTRVAPTSSSPGHSCLQASPTCYGIKRFIFSEGSAARRRAARHDRPHCRVVSSTTSATCRGERAGARRALRRRPRPLRSTSLTSRSSCTTRRESLHDLPADCRDYLEAGGAARQRRAGDLAQQAPPALVLRHPQQRARPA